MFMSTMYSVLWGLADCGPWPNRLSEFVHLVRDSACYYSRDLHLRANQSFVDDV